MRTATVVAVFLFAVLQAPAQLLDAREYRNVDRRLRSLVRPETPRKGAAQQPWNAPIVGKRRDGEDLYAVIIHSAAPDKLRALGFNIQSTLPDRATARLTRDELVRLAAREDVRFIEASGTEFIHNDVAATLTGARLLNRGYLQSTAYTGSGVLVGIIDTGIDWAHLDFRDPTDTTKTRIAAIWDQSIDSAAGDVRPSGYSYGVEYSKTQIENELDGSPAGFVREQDTNGHGTHVAGTAAGNGAALSTRKYAGMAPEATILFVKAGNGSFPTTNIIDGLSWLQQKATDLGMPIVVNMSLGSDYGSHDGTDSKSAAMNAFADAGRVVVVSAGNSGAANEHVSGTVPGSGTYDVTMTIPSYTAAAGAGNDRLTFDFWFDGTNAVTVQVTTPNGLTSTQTAGGERTDSTNDGAVYLWNFIDGANGDREVYVDMYDAVAGTTPATGTWTIHFTNTGGGSIGFHGWLYDFTIGAGSTVVTPAGANANYTLGNSSSEAIIVGSYIHRWRWHSSGNGSNYSYGLTEVSDTLSSFSSKGPTRTGAQKPDITAPGQAMVSALSRNSAPANSDIVVSGLYLKEQGTSMSSPATAGCVALLLQQDPTLTAASALALITETADQDVYTGASLPDAGWGYGKVDVFRAMEKLINPSYVSSRSLLAYDGWTGDGNTALSANDSVAVRFTPNDDGKVVAALFYTSMTVGLTSPMSASVRMDDGSGSPGTAIGESGTLGASAVSQYSWNVIPLDSAGISVTSGQDYHLILTYATGGATNLRLDNGSIDNRTSIKFSSGGGWTSQAFDLRIRPVIANDAAALPVQLLAFNASAHGSAAELTWRTATEENNAGWEVERRKIADFGLRIADWKAIGFVAGAGTSTSPHDYGFNDASLAAGRYAYRLRQVDRDGGSRLSQEAEVVVAAPRSFAVSAPYPNPFNPETAVDVALAEPSHVRVTVIDLLGRQVAIVNEGEWYAGTRSAKVDGRQLASGVYMCRVEAVGMISGVRSVGLRRMVLVK